MKELDNDVRGFQHYPCETSKGAKIWTWFSHQTTVQISTCDRVWSSDWWNGGQKWSCSDWWHCSKSEWHWSGEYKLCWVGWRSQSVTYLCCGRINLTWTGRIHVTFRNSIPKWWYAEDGANNKAHDSTR